MEALSAIRSLLGSSHSVMLLAAVTCLVIWIGGAIYSEQVADEKGYNIWVARVVSLLLPVLGPAVYWFLGRRPSPGPPNEV